MTANKVLKETYDSVFVLKYVLPIFETSSTRKEVVKMMRVRRVNFSALNFFPLFSPSFSATPLFVLPT
jgi:hypothetical protein